MSTNDKNQEVEPQDQNQLSDDDAAFMAGFAEARGEEPPVPDEPEIKEVKDSDKSVSNEPPDTQQEETKQEPVSQELIAGLTREQLMESLAKSGKAEEDVRKAFGKIGEIQRSLQNLQTTNNGEPVALTKEDFADLAEDFPDLAEKIAKGLNGKFKALTSAPSGPAVNVDDLAKKFEEQQQTALEQLERKYEMKLLALSHSDWREVAASPDFSVWKSTLPADIQLQIDNSWDSSYLSKTMSTFKEWRDKSVQNKQQRTARLENAITPDGSKTRKVGLSDEDAFSAGFKAVRGIK